MEVRDIGPVSKVMSGLRMPKDSNLLVSDRHLLSRANAVLPRWLKFSSGPKYSG